MLATAAETGANDAVSGAADTAYSVLVNGFPMVLGVAVVWVTFIVARWLLIRMVEKGHLR